MKFVNAPDIVPAPNDVAPLAGVVTLETDEPSSVEIDIDDGHAQRTVSFGPATEHRCPVLGLKPHAQHRLTVRAKNAAGDVIEGPSTLELKTPPLPDDFPPIKVELCQADKREPGFMVFPSCWGVMMKVPDKRGFLVAMNQQGDIVWYYRYTGPIYDVRRLANGNLVFAGDNYRINEIDMLGNTVNTWYPTGKFKDGLDGAIPVEAETVHHALCVMPSGNFLTLSIEQRDFDDWPGSDKDAAAPRAPAKVMGDVVVEFQPDGKVVNEWKLLDLLDPQRICYGSFAPFWVMKGYKDTYDWSHANGVGYDPNDDAVLVSVRHQDAVIKIDRATGQLAWILGTHDNWQAPWSDKLLAPADGLEWQFHQHNVSVTPDGGILMFDNGNFRATPYDKQTPAPDNHSRAVEFAIDRQNMTVAQKWVYDAGRDSNYYATYVGGAYRLPESGNTYITYGGLTYEDDGTPSDNNQVHRIRTRHIEVTGGSAPEKVFELLIEDPSENDAIRWFSFRSEHLPSLYG